MTRRRSKTARCALAVALATVAIAGTALAGAALADAPLPFEGTWVRADRVCSAAAPSPRTYSARTLITPAGRCIIRKVAFGAGEFEVFEDCRRPDRGGNVLEKIKMLGPDAFILKFQANRLKIPRGRKFLRCTIAAPRPPVPTPGRLPINPTLKPGATAPPLLNQDPD